MYSYFPSNPELSRHDMFESRGTGRPATHLEVIQRNRQVDRRHWLSTMERADDSRALVRRKPTRFDGVRRAISRALIQTGERIDPQAA